MQTPKLTETDYKRLSALSLALSRKRKPDRASALNDRIKNALAFQAENIEHVAMGSSVEIRDEQNGEKYLYTLVFPADADIEGGRISVLSPLGSELLGRRSGEAFRYESPGGWMSVRVEKILHEG